MTSFDRAKRVFICGAALLLSAAMAGAADLPPPPAPPPPTVSPFYSLLPLPSTQLCRAYHQASGLPMVPVTSSNQAQEWCDPGNNDLLQADVFTKLANGKAGSYRITNKDYPCVGSSSPSLPVPPSGVTSVLCGHH